MSDKTPSANPLVPGRECGGCDVCCVELTIEDPELQKVQGYRCRHLSPGQGCGIYATRPRTCREFHCGWRSLKWVRETLRPDRSGVLVRLHYEVAKSTGVPRLGVIFSLLTEASLKAEGLAESVAAAVNAEIPVHIHVPGPPGHTAGQARINEILLDAVRARDKPAVLRILREARKRGLVGDHRPIVLAPQPDGTARLAPEGRSKP
jgi:hypothetical protein